MKSNKKLINVLNTLLANELTAINQNMVHSEIYKKWGYNKLHINVSNQAMDEMHHAVWLVERIIFFEGIPNVSKINTINIGKTISEMINNDNEGKENVVNAYNDAIKFAREVSDQGTVDLLTKILIMEETHLDWIEKQHSQINQMGMENYLANQTEYYIN